MSARSDATELGFRLVERKGGGGGKGFGSGSRTKGGGTDGGKSSGSLKLPKGGPRGGGAVTHPYPGSRITIPKGVQVNHAPGEGNQGVVSWFGDDRHWGRSARWYVHYQG
jgi:hypothetical protein